MATLSDFISWLEDVTPDIIRLMDMIDDGKVDDVRQLPEAEVVEEEPKLFHERFPEILEWEIGDTIVYKGVWESSTGRFPPPLRKPLKVKYEGCNESGNIFVRDKDGVYKEWRYENVYVVNESLKSRRVKQKMHNSEKYNTLIKTFQEEVRKLNAPEEEQLNDFDRRLINE